MDIEQKSQTMDIENEVNRKRKVSLSFFSFSLFFSHALIKPNQ
jgi:hypothetical protein